MFAPIFLFTNIVAFLFVYYMGVGSPYYDVWAGDQLVNLGSPIGIRQFYMQGWSATGADLQHFGLNQAHVVFTSGNAVVQANLKGQGLSNDPIAYNSNSQRKVVKLYNGYLISI